MLPHGFWSNRQLLMRSICPPWLPACSKEDLQAAGRAWSSWGWGSLLAAFLLLFLGHHVLPTDNPRASLQLNLLNLMHLFSICAFEGFGKFKPLRFGVSQRWVTCSLPYQEHSSTVNFPLLSPASPPLPTLSPTPHPRLTPTPGKIPAEANRNITLERATGLD